jgi:hypothetical protein
MPESFNHFEVRRYYEIRVPDLRLSNHRKWRGPCPIHKGKGWNFAVDAKSGFWFCFSQCCRGGDIIGLERELSCVDFLTARRDVYRIIGRALPANTRGFGPGERRRLAHRRDSARDLGDSARRWHHATVAMLRHQKATEPAFSAAWITSCQALANSERMTPREILETYLSVAREKPEETARCVKWAEEEERECAQITAIVVRLIAAAENAQNAT